MRRQSGDMEAPCFDVQEEQHIDFDQSAQGPHLLGEEVARPESGGVAFNEVVPSILTAFGSGVETCLSQDIDHGGSGYFATAELLQFAENAGIAPIVRHCQPQHQFADRLGFAQPS